MSSDQHSQTGQGMSPAYGRVVAKRLLAPPPPPEKAKRPSSPSSSSSWPSAAVVDDKRTRFPSCFVQRRQKTEMRRAASEAAMAWIRCMHTLGVQGCVIFDIDDTLINGNESVRSGFEFMVSMYNDVFPMYPVHIVTARPDDEHDNVMQMLKGKGVCLPPDRLHMLPHKQYYATTPTLRSSSGPAT